MLPLLVAMKWSDEERLIATYTQTTESIQITVRPQSLEERTHTVNNVYAFAYTITIENLGNSTVQLLEREWFVHSAEVPAQEVRGAGVVGKQPVLEPGEFFEYTSSVTINDPIGSMEGFYTFQNSRGEKFKVKIPKFDLVYPVLVH